MTSKWVDGNLRGGMTSGGRGIRGRTIFTQKYYRKKRIVGREKPYLKRRDLWSEGSRMGGYNHTQK